MDALGVPAPASAAAAERCAGIAAGGSIGTLIEHNRIRSCARGITTAGTAATPELIIRHNCFRDVPQVVNIDPSSGGNVGQFIARNNIGEWPTATYTNGCRGIYLHGPGGTATFKKLILRDNIFRRQDNTLDADDTGLDIDSYGEAVLDNNIVDLSTLTAGARYSGASTKVLAMNNLRNDGTLLLGYNSTLSRSVQELATEADDVLLTL